MAAASPAECEVHGVFIRKTYFVCVYNYITTDLHMRADALVSLPSGVLAAFMHKLRESMQALHEDTDYSSKRIIYSCSVDRLDAGVKDAAMGSRTFRCKDLALRTGQDRERRMPD